MSRNGLDFEEETKARMNTCQCEYYKKMTLFECLADCMEETVEYEINPEKLWRSLTLVQRRIFAQHAPARRDLCYKESSDQPSTLDKEVYKDSTGCFIIPASSTISAPSKSLLIMPSFSGGNQVHLSCGKYMEDQQGSLDYEIPQIVPSGSYNLSCRMVNVNQKQMPLQLTIEKFEDALVDIRSIEVQYTYGTWQKTMPVRVDLKPGSLLKFSREEPCHGLSIKEFILEICGESI
jgi:hypothetical protein